MTWPIVEVSIVQPDGQRVTYAGRGTASFVETYVAEDDKHPSQCPHVRYLSASLLIDSEAAS